MTNHISIAPDIRRSSGELEVMKGRVPGEYIVGKYGRNPDVDAAADIWDGGGDFTGFPTSAAENFEVVSTSSDDASAGTGAREIRLYYYDDNYNVFDENGNFLYVDVSLNGLTAVDSGVSGMRLWRAKVISSGAGQANAGDITIRWATTESVVFSVIRAGFSQTEIACFTIPSGYKGYLKRYTAFMLDNNANRSEIAVKVRDFGSNTFRIVHPFVARTDYNPPQDLYGGESLDEKTDLVFRCLSIDNINGVIGVNFAVHLVEL